MYEEHISGAKRNEERPILCECLDYCIGNGVDMLLISELSRLGRNADEVLANVKRCKDNNLNIFFRKKTLLYFNPMAARTQFSTSLFQCLERAQRWNVKTLNSVLF